MPNAPESDRPENAPVPPVAASSSQTPGETVPASIPAATSGDAAAQAAPASPEDEFLDYEPLTPELLEEEAIRGDFVLRWAVILVALLLASTRIAEPRTLLHMKTGEYLASHGILPPKADVFSASIPNRPWTNLSWGFDLLTHVIHSPTALSLIKALLIALTFGLLVHISRPGVSSWWGSICAATAVMACMPHFTVEPHVITLLGTALLLWILHTSSLRDSSSRLIWGLVPLFLIWANLDGRAFIGLFLLLLYAAGTQLESLFQRDSATAERGVSPSTLWMVTGASVLIVLIHPFFYRVLAAPLALYGQEYPAYRNYLLQQPRISSFGIQFFSLIKTQFWNNPHVAGVVGVVLMAAAGAALILNWSQMQIRWLLVYLGAVLLAFLTIRELPVCSIVFCVVAVLNAQAWFQAEFRQTYSVETSEILFSRGGRAITVLLLAGLAFFGGTGRLSRTETARIGYGLDAQLVNMTQSLSDQLADSFDDNVFNYSPSAGDVLIYLGYKPYIDNRIALYTGTGTEENVVNQFLKTRGQLEEPQNKEWRAEWDRLGITHVIVPATDFLNMYALVRNDRNWLLTRLGASAAVFYRIEPSNAKLMDYLRKNRLDFFDEALHKAKPVALKHDPISPRSVYERYLWSRKREVPNKIIEALTLVRLAAVTAQFPRRQTDLTQTATSMAILGIRKAHEGLATNPDCPEGYMALGLGYAFLGKFETQKVMNKRQPLIENIRYIEAVSAFNQVLVADPYNIEALKELRELYTTTERTDLLLRTVEDLKKAYAIEEQKGEFQSKRYEDMIQTEMTITENMKNDLTVMVEQMDTAIRDRVSEGQPIPQIAGFCMQQGYSLRALEQLDKATEILSQNPQLQQLRIALLLEVGRVTEAEEAARMFQQNARQEQLPNWQITVANAYIPSGEHSSAVQVLSELVKERSQSGMTRLLKAFSPQVSLNPLEPWPINASAATSQMAFDTSNATVDARFRSAQLLIEIGELEDARKNLDEILVENPDYLNRPLVAYYLWLLTGNLIDSELPSKAVPVLFEKSDNAPADKPAKPEAAAKAPADKPATAEAPATAPADKPVKAETPAKAPADKPTKVETPAKAPADKPTKAEAPAKAPADKPATAEAPAKAPADKPAKAEAAAKTPAATPRSK